MPEAENITSSSPPKSIDIDETLIRIILHPDHIDDAGKLKPSAISSDQLKCGASVDRQKYASRNHIEENIKIQISRVQGRRFSRFGLIKHAAVQNINDTDDQSALNVKADPLSDNPAHALIELKNEYQPSQIKKSEKLSLMNSILSRILKTPYQGINY
jgi:hypothetical protein